jgi:hypothetical protein
MPLFQMIHNKIPDVGFLRVIGCTAYVHKHQPLRSSVLDTIAIKGVLIGYATNTKGYRIMVSNSPIKKETTMHVTFSEDLLSNPSQLLSLPDRHGDPDDESSSNISHNEIDDEATSETHDQQILAPDEFEHVVQEHRDTNRSSPYPQRERTLKPNTEFFMASNRRINVAQAAKLSLPMKVSFRETINDPMIREV